MSVKNGELYDFWLVIDDTHVVRKRKRYALCKCTSCNVTVKYVQVANLKDKLKTKKCANCYRVYKGDYTPDERQYYSKLKSRALKTNIPFKVSIKQIFDVLEKQGYKCIYTGLDINFHLENSTKTASLDRKDSSLGYLKNNIQWVHKDVNFMKNHLEESYFLSLVKLIYENTIKNECTKLRGSSSS